jgi:hypothetical protein
MDKQQLWKYESSVQAGNSLETSTSSRANKHYSWYSKSSLRRLAKSAVYIYVYIYVWKLNQTVLELDFIAVKFLFFPNDIYFR